MNKKTCLFLTFLIISALVVLNPSELLAYGEGVAKTDKGDTPVCSEQVPDKPWLYTVKNLGKGSVEAQWAQTNRANSWTVAYGVKSGHYIYGVHNFGNSESRSLKVSSLPAGTYYFVVRANNGCMPGPFSNEWKVVVGGGGVVTVANLGTTPVVQPTRTPVAEQITPKATPTVKATPTTRATPTVSQQAPKVQTPTPTPAPANRGFFGSIADFFRNLFGAK